MVQKVKTKKPKGQKQWNTIWLKIIVGLIGAVIFAALLYYANHDRPRYTITEENGTEYETAKVIKVLEDTTTIDETTENVRKGSMKLIVKLLTGRYKGEEKEITNYFSAMYNIYVKEGDKVSVRVDTYGKDQYDLSIYNYERSTLLIVFVVLFMGGLILVGGKSGLRAVLGLVFTMLNVIFLLVPLVLKGYSPIGVTIGVLTLTTVVSFILIGGIQPKITSAMLGTLGGVLISALLATISGNLVHISAFQSEEAEALLLIKSEAALQLKGLFISGILIAAVGAVMDVAITISSALEEIYQIDSRRTKKELIQSGMNIGRDAMGTMANTLILAFAGSSLNMMVLIYSYGVTFNQLMNTDFVAIEIIKSIAGSLGIVFTVPIVSFISACILTRKKGKNNFKLKFLLNFYISKNK